MIPNKYDRVDPNSKTNGVNKHPRRAYNDQIDVCLDLKTKLDRSDKYYHQLKTDYDNACYMARLMDATIDNEVNNKHHANTSN